MTELKQELLHVQEWRYSERGGTSHVVSEFGGEQADGFFRKVQGRSNGSVFRNYLKKLFPWNGDLADAGESN